MFFFFPAGVVAAGCTEHEPQSLALSWCLWFPAKPNVPTVKHSSHVFLSQKESTANLSFRLELKNMQRTIAARYTSHPHPRLTYFLLSLCWIEVEGCQLFWVLFFCFFWRIWEVFFDGLLKEKLYWATKCPFLLCFKVISAMSVKVKPLLWCRLLNRDMFFLATLYLKYNQDTQTTEPHFTVKQRSAFFGQQSMWY